MNSHAIYGLHEKAGTIARRSRRLTGQAIRLSVILLLSTAAFAQYGGGTVGTMGTPGTPGTPGAPGTSSTPSYGHGKAIGIGVGAAVGMLFAPKAGAETQAYLKDKSREAVDTLRQQAHDLRDQAGEIIQRGRPMRDQAKNSIDAIDAGIQACREMVEEA